MPNHISHNATIQEVKSSTPDEKTDLLNQLEQVVAHMSRDELHAAENLVQKLGARGLKSTLGETTEPAQEVIRRFNIQYLDVLHSPDNPNVPTYSVTRASIKRYFDDNGFNSKPLQYARLYSAWDGLVSHYAVEHQPPHGWHPHYPGEQFRTRCDCGLKALIDKTKGVYAKDKIVGIDPNSLAEAVAMYEMRERPGDYPRVGPKVSEILDAYVNGIQITEE